MTELIAALDGPGAQLVLLDTLYHRVGIRWFKIGEQTTTDPLWSTLLAPRKYGYPEANIFVDLKLAGTRAAAREAVKRWAGFGVAAVSVSTDETTEAALSGAEGSPLRVWRVVALTERPSNLIGERTAEIAYRAGLLGAHGIICPGGIGRMLLETDVFKGDLVTAGVRRKGEDTDNHDRSTWAEDCVGFGVTYAVVGLWRAKDPVAAALAYRELLRCPL